MQTKLHELTEKIYQEGVVKANEEAERIIAKARASASELKSAAEEEAEAILIKARKDAAELTKTSMNELQMASRQAMSDLKNKIASLIEMKTVAPATAPLFGDSGFVKELIALVVKNWDAGSGEPVDLEVLLPVAKQAELEAWFKEQTTTLMNQGLKIAWSEKVKGGFMIGPAAGGYRISFSDSDFNQFLLGYLRPRLVELLFDSTAG